MYNRRVAMGEDAAPFDFVARTPPAPLDRLVRSIWYARGTITYTREKIAPTGSTVAVFVLGDPIIETPDNGAGAALHATRGFLVGPHDRPVINEPTGETFAIGIVSSPIGCQAIFEVPPAAIRGRVVDLEAAWPAAAALRARLSTLRDPEQMLAVVERQVDGGRAAGDPALARCERAVTLLEEAPTRPIADIAAELGISHGHLDREFTRIAGLAPRTLARLLRMRRLLAELDVRSDIQWAELALDGGWFDQAHFIRDFKRYTGVTPRRYLAAQRASFTPDEAEEAAGFVPES